MSRNACCVPGCGVTIQQGVPLQKFPNPDNDLERFNLWVNKIGGAIGAMDKKFVYLNRTVCRRHFAEVYHYPKNRLSSIAVPSLNLPEPMEIVRMQQQVTENTADSPNSAGPSNTEQRPQPEPMEIVRMQQQVTENTADSPNIRKRDHTPPGHCKILPSEKRELTTLKKKLNKVQCQMNTYKQRLAAAKKISRHKSFDVLTSKLTKGARIFFNMQLKMGSKLGRKAKGRRFTLNEKILALSLYKPSPKAYRHLSQLCVLPTKRTLQKLLNDIALKPGINEKIFTHLRKRVSRLPDNQKYCTVIFDEMAIAASCSYNQSSDTINGFCKNSSKYCDHVIVFMVRGIVKKFKQPVCYSFTAGTVQTIDLKNLLKEVIRKLHECGLRVVATICDQGTTNMAAINQLQKETQANYLRQNINYKGGFFEIDDAKVHNIYDPPHLMKGIRNNMLEKNLTYKLKGHNKVAKWSHIEALYERAPGYRGVKLVPKLTAQHVRRNHIPKMKVKNCTQVFSHTVGVTLGYMADTGVLPAECSDTADILLLFDKIFDSVNGGHSDVRGGKIYRTAVTPKSPHLKLWRESLPVLKSMQFISASKRGTVPSLSSWVKTLEGLLDIVEYLHSEGINSILLRQAFNQDALENFFGAIRAHGYANIMPDSSAFEAAYKTLLVNNLTSHHTIGFNCEKDDGIYLQSLKYFLRAKDKKSEEKGIDVVDSQHLNIDLLNIEQLLMSNTRNDIEKCAAIGYCSGWVAHKAKFVTKKCKKCTEDLQTNKLEKFHDYIKMREFSNKTWLCYPTRGLFNFFAQVEHITYTILKENPHRDNILEYIKLIITVNISFDFMQCDVHKQQLKNYILKKGTLFFIRNWCKEINCLLTGKSELYDPDDQFKVSAHNYYNKNKLRKRIRQTGIVLNV